jgi:hypothetical protein
MALKGPKISTQGTAGKSKHVTLTIPQKLEIIRRPECGKSQREVTASYNTGSSTTCDIKRRRVKWKSFSSNRH